MFIIFHIILGVTKCVSVKISVFKNYHEVDNIVVVAWNKKYFKTFVYKKKLR